MASSEQTLCRPTPEAFNVVVVGPGFAGVIPQNNQDFE